MGQLNLNKTFLYLILGFSLFIIPSPGLAQPILTSAGPDPEVLITPNNNSGKNLETTLVDIKAVDAPVLLKENGKTGIARQERNGQGIIIDPQGIIATNKHIIKNAQHIYVLLSDGRTFEGTVLRNSQADLCFLKINTPLPLKAISMANSSEIRIGNKITAFANAELNPQSIVNGQVVKIFKGQSSNNVELLEMNLRLQPGDSGGPILNEEGYLLGLIMGKQISDPSKSFAIASNVIKQEYFKYRNSI